MANTPKPTPKADTPPASVLELGAAAKTEIPEAIRSIAEKSAKQTKENIENIRTSAEQATDVLEETYARAIDGGSEFRVKAIEAARDNVNAAFDFAVSLTGAKSLSEIIELHTAHARKQFEAFSAQSKDLAQIAGKVATESTKPYQDLLSKTLSSTR